MISFCIFFTTGIDHLTFKYSYFEYLLWQLICNKRCRLLLASSVCECHYLPCYNKFEGTHQECKLCNCHVQFQTDYRFQPFDLLPLLLAMDIDMQVAVFADADAFLKIFNGYYFLKEFHEICLLGKGEFGSVHKCLNRLDGCTYAVKKSLMPVAGSPNE